MAEEMIEVEVSRAITFTERIILKIPRARYHPPGQPSAEEQSAAVTKASSFVTAAIEAEQPLAWQRDNFPKETSDIAAGIHDPIPF